jgi:hypothetical protein
MNQQTETIETLLEQAYGARVRQEVRNFFAGHLGDSAGRHHSRLIRDELKQSDRRHEASRQRAAELERQFSRRTQEYEGVKAKSPRRFLFDEPKEVGALLIEQMGYERILEDLRKSVEEETARQSSLQVESNSWRRLLSVAEMITGERGAIADLHLLPSWVAERDAKIRERHEAKARQEKAGAEIRAQYRADIETRAAEIAATDDCRVCTDNAKEEVERMIRDRMSLMTIVAMSGYTEQELMRHAMHAANLPALSAI